MSIKEGTILLSARGVSKAYGARALFDDVTLHVRAGERVGIVGANGTGKSTLLSICAGTEPADVGMVERKTDARIEYLSQEPVLDESKNAREIVLEGLAAWSAAMDRFNEVSHLLGDSAASLEASNALVTEQAALAETIESLGGFAREHVIDEYLLALGIADTSRPVRTMSGGEKRRVALARLLVSAPDLAILDEPTNHLDADVVEWLEEMLAESFPGAVLVVTHDRYVLDAIATRIVELDQGALHSYDGDFADYIEGKANRQAMEARIESNRQNTLRREKAWLARGAKARSTKQKARIQRAEALLAERGPQISKELELAGLGVGSSRTGGTILEFDHASYVLPGAPPRPLLTDFTFRMVKGERLGVVGKNGAGKTTLLRLATAEIMATSGTVVRGKNTKISHFDQTRSGLEDGWSIFDNVAGRQGAETTGGGMVELGRETMDLRTYLEIFLFEPAKQRQKVGSLSGGERARVSLAKVLKEGSNLLLLDEPTNDLDLYVLGALESLLETWPGCLVVVSHDRAFLDRVATKTLVFEGEGKVVAYPGGYSTARAIREANAKAARASLAPAAPGTGARSSRGASAPAPLEASAPRRPSAPVAALKPLTFAERKELDGIIDAIAAAEAKVETLLARQSAGGRAQDAGASKALREEHAAAVAEVSRLTARWEALEARKDAKK